MTVDNIGLWVTAVLAAFWLPGVVVGLLLAASYRWVYRLGRRDQARHYVARVVERRRVHTGLARVPLPQQRETSDD